MPRQRRQRKRVESPRTLTETRNDGAAMTPEEWAEIEAYIAAWEPSREGATLRIDDGAIVYADPRPMRITIHPAHFLEMVREFKREQEAPRDYYSMTIHPENLPAIIQAAGVHTRAEIEAWLEAWLEQGSDPL